VQEVLVDRCQFVPETEVQEFDDFGVAFNGALLLLVNVCVRGIGECGGKGKKLSNKNKFICK